LILCGIGLKFRRTRTNDNAKLAENVCHIAANVSRIEASWDRVSECFSWKRMSKVPKMF
jgi:hypothetical protein